MRFFIIVVAGFSLLLAPASARAQDPATPNLRKLFKSDLAWDLAVSTTPTAPVLTLSSLSNVNYRLGDPPIRSQRLQVTANLPDLRYEASPTVSWLSVSPNFGPLPASLEVRIDPSGLSPGTYSGGIRVTAPGAEPVTAVLTLEVSDKPALVVPQDTVNFSHLAGASPPGAHTVKIDSTGPPLAFTAAAQSAGWLTVSPPSGTTPADLAVAVNTAGLTAGSYTGLVTIVASGSSNSPQMFQVNLTVRASNLPAIREAGVVNGASFSALISPGSWVAILGDNLSTIAAPGRVWTDAEIADGTLPLSLEGTSVRINNRPAAIYFIGPGQLNVQAPDDDSEGPVQVEVTTPNGVARAVAQLRRHAPGLFQARQIGTGRYYPAALHGDDYATVETQPAGRPLRPGEVLLLYGTGFGPTNPPRPAGRFIDPAPHASTVTVSIGGIPARTLFAGLISPGLTQINVEVPSAGDGDQPVAVEVNGVQTQVGIFVPIQR